MVQRAYAASILDGRKTVEARLTVGRKPPWDCIADGERLYFKVRSGSFFATALVSRIWSFCLGTDGGAVARLRAQFDRWVLGEDAFWESKARARYATMIAFDTVQQVRFGPKEGRLTGRDARSAWRLMPGEACVFPACIREEDPVLWRHRDPRENRARGERASKSA